MPAPEAISDLLKAANDASGKAFALWLTFLTVGTYFAIAIGTTTHLQLLLAGPVKLPLLGVDLPLFAFYGFAPPLYVILHLYVLIQLYLLARLLRLFDDDLRAADMIEQDRRRVRGQLDKFVFTQCLIGAPEEGIVRLFLRAAVLLSFILGPISAAARLSAAVLALPQHRDHLRPSDRIALLLDLILLLLLWPKITRGRAQNLTSQWKVVCRIGSVGSVSVLLVAFAVVVATIPGELTHQRRWDELEGRLLSRIIFLPDQRLIEPDENKLQQLTVTLQLPERDFREAFFLGADLRKAYLRYSNLRQAILSGARLGSAQLSDTDLSGADLIDADLANARLVNAKLTGAHLRGAELPGVDLVDADLSGADLIDANLSNARLVNTKLINADANRINLSNANLNLAVLRNAHMVGADLRNADLSDADLTDADLSGADLIGAKNVRQEQLSQACGTDVKLPRGLTLWPCSSSSVSPTNAGASR